RPSSQVTTASATGAITLIIQVSMLFLRSYRSVCPGPSPLSFADRGTMFRESYPPSFAGWGTVFRESFPLSFADRGTVSAGDSCPPCPSLLRRPVCACLLRAGFPLWLSFPHWSPPS